MKRRVWLAMGLALVLAIPNRVLAQFRWYAISLGDPVIAVDTQTVVVAGDTLTVWLRIQYAKPRHYASGKTYSYSMNRMDFNCNASQFRVREELLYSAAGDVVSDDKPSYGYGDWQSAVPETVGESELRGVCRYRNVLDGSLARDWAEYQASPARNDSLRRRYCEALKSDATIGRLCAQVEPIDTTGRLRSRTLELARSKLDSIFMIRPLPYPRPGGG